MWIRKFTLIFTAILLTVFIFPSLAGTEEQPIAIFHTFNQQFKFAQVQPDNIYQHLDIKQVNKRLNKLEESFKKIDAKKKDFWDKFKIIGTLLIPISIAVVGGYYSNSLKMIEIRRGENRDSFEQQIAQINTRARQAELLSKLMPTLLSKDSKQRTLGIKAISMALPEEAEALVAVLSETDPDEEVQNIAKESLKVLKLENLVRNRYELEHLYRIYEGEKQPRRISFKNRGSFLAELRYLRTLGLIENKPDKTIGGMPDSGDLRDHVKLTQDGKDYIESRERYGLANPRREKNSEFWSSDKNN